MNEVTKTNTQKQDPGSAWETAISQTLSKVSREISHLATEDYASVFNGVKDIVSEELESRPYQTLTVAAGIGFGLGALTTSHLKTGALRIAKLIAMKALSDVGGEKEGRTQTDGGVHEAKTA